MGSNIAPTTLGMASAIWSSDNPAVATVDASTGVVTGVSAGTATITCSLTANCTTTQTAVVTVNALPVVPAITGNTMVIKGSTSTLSNTVTGGIWSSDNTAIATVDANTGVVSGVALGTANISYTVSSNGCSATAGTGITVVGGITGTTVFCAGSTSRLADATAGGVWSSSNTGIATVDVNGIVTGISAGTAIINYTIAGIGTVTAGITVNALPVVPAITGNTMVIKGSTSTLSNTVTSGIWSSDNTAIATVDANTGVVSGAALGTANISYTVSSNGCSATAGTGITVVGGITGTTVFCAGSTSQLADATAGGVWSSSNTGIATVDVNGIATGVSAGTATLNYTIAGIGTVTTGITVNALPVVPAITGNTMVIKGAAATLSNTVTGGIWSSDNTAIATVDATTGVVSGIALGTANISYTVSSNGCSATVSSGITVVGGITGTSVFCAGSTSRLADATAGGVWSSSNTGIATVDVNGMVTGVGAGTAILNYTIAGIGTVTTGITVNALPVVPAITGNTMVIKGSTSTLSNTVTGGIWSSDNTAIATVDANTGAVSGAALGTANISYTVSSNGCSATASSGITVVGGITGTSVFCAGSTSRLADATAVVCGAAAIQALQRSM